MPWTIVLEGDRAFTQQFIAKASANGRIRSVVSQESVTVDDEHVGPVLASLQNECPKAKVDIIAKKIVLPAPVPQPNWRVTVDTGQFGGNYVRESITKGVVAQSSTTQELRVDEFELDRFLDEWIDSNMRVAGIDFIEKRIVLPAPIPAGQPTSTSVRCPTCKGRGQV